MATGDPRSPDFDPKLYADWLRERQPVATNVGLNTRGMPGGGSRISDPNMNIGGVRYDPNMKFESRAMAERVARQYGMSVVPDITLRNGNTLYRLEQRRPMLPGFQPDSISSLSARGRNTDLSDYRDAAVRNRAISGSAPSAPSSRGSRRRGGVTSTEQASADAWNDYLAEQERLFADETAETVTSIFREYGLESLAPEIRRLAAEGLSSSEITLRLRETKPYQQTFGYINDARRKAGLSALSEGVIMGQRKTLREAMRRAGLPKGFYDSQDDFDRLIINDVSVDEVAARIKLAQMVVGESVQPEMAEAFKRYYGINKSDLVAYYLDPDRAEPLLQKQAQAAILGGEASNADLGIGRNYAENLVEKGVTPGAARQAFQDTAADMPQLDTLAGLDGVDLSQRDVIDANLDLSPKAAKKVKGLASRERARFGGGADASRSFGADNTGF